VTSAKRGFGPGGTREATAPRPIVTLLPLTN
jgi:hypothetical protein